ncbi:adenylyltransferase/sulfurtransferase [Halanaerobium saccharolyticum]|uniref:Adenylyltransferase/sulfurtransferase n=1 Tax=Halanaerobium saccharolyticum TaxID=43595 RepID=A0A4R7Z5I2_9FIRM|nr:sulfur carrier protein ThiS [Halanaerobium saccharolyticum]RAK12454.1 adenylyltransferase/sulfurtransferase [Halanaerobium saccharolyticum]TDW06380.1 adenylyltransferase/sulfurtransferase [Halanaerobium saccharolyticum]TDX61628.1 adenylyltransferase/sulfurtransferase [Halanaerobium saccharolyticum]
MSIKITVNGEEKEIKENLNLAELLAELEIDPEVTVVKLNDSMVPQGELAEREVESGDNIEYIFFMGGGAFDLTEEEIERYSRHIILKDLGGTGQQKIKDAKVLVVGAGGLGSPVAFYLAAAGVGTLGLVDSDHVDLTNLQRQILHTTEDTGRPKVDSAREKLEAMNPNVEVKTYNQYLNKDNVEAIIADYDIIVDGVDNFPTRYLLNDACVMAGKPLVEAGILQFSGQLTTIMPGEGPCYRCIFAEPPKEGAIPSCQEAGVLGAIAGTIGTLQATEVLKLITGIGRPLVGRMLVYDAKDLSFREVEVKKSDSCDVCGDNPVITELMEYELSCNLHQQAEA